MSRSRGKLPPATEGDSYADAVIGVLARDFPDLLTKPEVAAVVREQIHAHLVTRCGMEVIVDNPYLANWRLVGDRETGRVRLGCWKLNLNEYDRARFERLNGMLSMIPMEDGEQR